MRRLAMLLVFLALPAAAQSLDWSSPGAAGKIDPQTSLWTFNGSALVIGASNITTVDAFYPVTNTYGSAVSLTPAWGTLKMTYADNSSSGSVFAELLEVDACSSTQRQLCSITSSDGDGTPTCDTCTWMNGVDFGSHSYYVHVTVAKTDLPADPKLYSLAIY